MKVKQNLNLSQDTETTEDKAKRHVHEMLSSTRKIFYRNSEDTFFSIIEEWVMSEKFKTKAEDLIEQLSYGPTREMAKKMLGPDFQEDIPYFMGEEHWITYKTIKDGKEGKGNFTGDLKPLGAVIQSLGYVQVGANYLVKITHIVHIDANYVYLDTKERIRLSRTFKKRHEEALEKIHEWHPDFKFKTHEYREADLMPHRRRRKSVI